MSGSRPAGRPKWRRRDMRAAAGQQDCRGARLNAEMIAALARKTGALSRAVSAACEVDGAHGQPGMTLPAPLKLVREI